MILGGSLAEYTLSSFSVVFIYSGVFVFDLGSRIILLESDSKRYEMDQRT